MIIDFDNLSSVTVNTLSSPTDTDTNGDYVIYYEGEYFTYGSNTYLVTSESFYPYDYYDSYDSDWLDIALSDGVIESASKAIINKTSGTLFKRKSVSKSITISASSELSVTFSSISISDGYIPVAVSSWDNGTGAFYTVIINVNPLTGAVSAYYKNTASSSQTATVGITFLCIPSSLYSS